MNPLPAGQTASDVLSAGAVKEHIDDSLRRLFAERRGNARVIGNQYDFLWETIEKAALAGGKRIRPYLVMAVEGSGDERVWPIAVAQELIHIAVLIHDDIIDQDFIRHGQDNVSGIYRRAYGRYLEKSRARHYANAAAILAGDALISEAYRMIYGSAYDENTKSHLLDRLSQSIFDVVGGELLDVEAGFTHDKPVDPMQIYRYKTASYSFVGPILTGAIAAGLGEAEKGALQSFAENAGIAYQIQDDLLGIFGDEAKTGKSTLTDLREGKRTLLVAEYLELTDEVRRRRFGLVFGNEDAKGNELALLKADMEESGAKSKTAAIADEYFEKALECLETLPQGARKEHLHHLIDTIRMRMH